MKRFWTFLVAAVVIGVLVTPTAQAGSGKGKGKLSFSGMITALSVDADPATTDTITLDLIKGNKAARKWEAAHAGLITVTVNNDTAFSGAPATGLRVGDGLKVNARKSTDGNSLIARRARLLLQRYHGTVVSYDAGTKTIVVDWDKTSRLAKAWLAAHGNPDPVTAIGTADSKITGDPAAGDEVELRARPHATDASKLEARRVHAGT